VLALPFLPGARYKITRRCLERRFFLRPDADTTVLMGYCLALCATRYSMLIHAVGTMSNHYHIDITDPFGFIVEFKRDFNSMVARALNAKHGRFDKFWSADAPCDVRIVNDDDVLDRMVYTLVNPVAGGLVRSGRLWAGLTTWGQPFGTVMKFPKPKSFFAQDNSVLPEEASFTLERPDIYNGSSDAEVFAMLMYRVHERERQIQHEFRLENRRFLGMDRALAQHHDDTPAGREKRFGLTPKVASKSIWHRIAALQHNKRWLTAYREAFAKFREGIRDVLFPHGTYWMRVYCGVLCHPS